MLSRWQTTLHIEKPHPCPAEDIHPLPYDYQGILYSAEPFLVTSQKEPDKRRETQGGPSLSADLSELSSPKLLLTGGGGGPGPDDDSPFKYPFQPPFADQSDITLTLLPFLRLPPDWRNQLPGSQWFHWLFGAPDYDAGAVMNIQVNGESVARLSLHPWELRELAEDLSNSRQLLQKLAFRLNGREAFIQQLLDIQDFEEQGFMESFMDEETRGHIAQQLADVLEQADHSFSLELEWFSLQAELQQAEAGPEAAIIQAPGRTKIGLRFGKSSRGNSGAGSPAKNPGTAAGDQPDQSEPPPSDDQGGEDHPPSPPPENTTDNNISPGSELTITFIGHSNAGKSSLASALLGGKLFPSGESRTEFRESDVVVTPNPNAPLETMRVRSLPGTGAEETDSWLEQNPIAPEELVIVVFNNSLSEEDADILEKLTEGGHSPGRIIFVRNYFDAVLNAEINRRQRAGTISQPEKEAITKGLQEKLVDEFTENLDELFGHGEGQGQELLFTSCTNIYECEGLDLLLRAIGSSVSREFPHQARKSVWDSFSAIRRQVRGKLKQYSGIFRQHFKSERSVACEVLKAVLYMESVPLPNRYSSPEEYIPELLQYFRKDYGYDFEDRVIRLWYLSTWEAAESEKIKSHAEALIRKNQDDQERYLDSLYEQAKLDPQVLSDPELTDVLDFSAHYKAAQYAQQFRASILATMKKQLWLHQRWATSDEQLLKRFKDQLGRAIETELLLARYRRMLPPVHSAAAKAPSGMEPDMGADMEQPLSGQTFQEILKTQIDELASQFSAILLGQVILPAYYHLPVSETPVSETPVSETPVPAPALSLPEAPQSFSLIPESWRSRSGISSTTANPSGEPQESTAEPVPAQLAGVDENRVSVVLANGFQNQYTIDPPPFFTRSEMGAILAAFASQSDSSHKLTSSLTVTCSGQGVDYYYQVDPLKRFTGTNLHRSRIQIKNSRQPASALIEIWVDFERSSDPGDKALPGLIKQLSTMEPCVFAPRAFVYNNDLLPESPLLLTRAAPLHMRHLVVLQNSKPSEAGWLLAGLRTFTRRQRFSPQEVLELAIKLVTGLKTLASQQLTLDVLNIAEIGIDPEHWQPYPGELRILRPLISDNPDQEITDWILRQANRAATEAAADSSDNEPHGARTIKWLGQVFVLLSGQSPLFYQKSIVSKIIDQKDMPRERQSHLDAFDESQLRDHVTDLLVRSGIKRNWRNRFPDVHRGHSISQNLLLMARLMLRDKPEKRPSLDQIIKMLEKIHPVEREGE